MLFWMQIGSALAGFGAGLLWFRSATAKAPPLVHDGGARLQMHLDNGARLNRWAAAFTAGSMLLSAWGSILAAMGGQ